MNFYIEELIKEIENKLNWKNVHLWTDGDYKKLSQLISEKTNVLISPQTLKRLFGKVKYKEDYTPQQATTDALANFLGYKNWDGFLDSKRDKIRLEQKFSLVLHILRSNKFLVIFIGTLLVILLSVSFFYFKSRENTVVFNAKNLTGFAPHTLSINYDISKINTNDVFIDFDQKEAEDSLSKEKLDKSRILINHCFETPGFYNVRLWMEGKVKSTIKVHVISNEWDHYYFNKDDYSLRKFVFGLENKIKDTINDGLLYISPKEISNQGFRANTVYYLENMLYKDFRVSGDSCSFEVKYKNSPETGGISCFDVEFRIIGENGIASVMLVQKGCYRWSEVTIGEVHLNGKYHDLTKLSTDMSEWKLMRLIIEKRKARVINENDIIFECAYNQVIGKIKGIRFVTKGSGSFDDVKLSDSQGHLIYEDNFGD